VNENKPALKHMRLGSRTSDLALWQTHHVRDLLLKVWANLDVSVETMTTKGDQILDTPLPLIGGKGLFTSELEDALRSGAVDAAVHSLKDLPTEMPSGLALGAVPQRANPADALVSRDGYTLTTLPRGATVGTSSRRRAAQLLTLRPDLRIQDLRGNVPTRIRKAQDQTGPYDAIVLALAGLERLGRQEAISQILSLEEMLPAPAQAALGIQCRADTTSMSMLSPLNHANTHMAVTAERCFLNGLGGGCSLPIAAYASIEAGSLTLLGRVSALDGSRQIDTKSYGSPNEARELGQALAQEALHRGAGRLLEALG